MASRGFGTRDHLKGKQLGILLLCAVAGSSWAQESNVIREVLIRGNTNVTQDAIVASMRTKVGQPYVQATLDADKASIEAMGFFSAVDVRATPLSLGSWQIVVDVKEWPRIKEIRVVGNSAITTDAILKAIKLVPGDVYNLNALKPSSDAIEKLYSSQGYFAQVEEFAPLQESPGTINISIIEMKVGSVAVQGNKRTKDWVFKRLIKTRPGDTYSQKKWILDLRRLVNTQWFDPVTNAGAPPTDLGKIDLVAGVTEARTGNFNVGLQVDPRSSVAGILRVSDTNFRGTGQTLGVNFIQATQGDGGSVDLNYSNPFFDDRQTTFNISLYSRLIYRFGGGNIGSSSSSSTTDRYNERRTGGTIGFSRPQNDALTYGLSARYERISTDNTVESSANNFVQQDGEVGVLSIASVSNRRDVDVDPSRGDWLRWEVEPGYANITKSVGPPSTLLLGSSTFVRNTLEYRTYFTNQKPRGDQLDAPRRVLALRAKYGVISGNVPFFEQFFAGGSDSVRGYAEDRFWGRQTLLTTIEYRYPLQKSFNLIGFYDYGGAWGGYDTVNDYTQSNSIRLHSGYGFGFSFRTPLGPIRLDFGWSEKGKSRTHFQIGFSF
ncbi:MAG: BamA/OMP85 family outer membrane protein [Fimbriimonas sp.]